jgi:hypothetical protein
MQKEGFCMTEAQEQKTLIDWTLMVRGKYPVLKLLYAIPNGGSRNIIEAANLKRQGVKSGVPDLCLPVARNGYHGLYIELKTAKGRTSENQDAWIAELRGQGYRVEVAMGCEEAIEILRGYLSGI